MASTGTSASCEPGNSGAFMKRISAITLIVIAMWTAVPAHAQDATPNRLTVTWSDPSRPGLLKVNLIDGGITVKTHPGSDVTIESKTRGGSPPSGPSEPGVLRRIDAGLTGLTV